MAKNGEIHELTVAEVAMLTARFVGKRQRLVEERAQIYAARAGAGTDAAIAPVLPPGSEEDEEIRQIALAKLNGWAPPSLRLPPPVDHDRVLRLEILALDRVIAATRANELVARATAAAEWSIAHGAEWKDMCRDYVLSATHLQALEEQMERVRREAPGPTAMLPCAEYLGTGRSPIGVKWVTDPMSRLREAALQQKIVTKSELDGARYA